MMIIRHIFRLLLALVVVLIVFGCASSPSNRTTQKDDLYEVQRLISIGDHFVEQDNYDKARSSYQEALDHCARITKDYNKSMAENMLLAVIIPGTLGNMEGAVAGSNMETADRFGKLETLIGERLKCFDKGLVGADLRSCLHSNTRTGEPTNANTSTGTGITYLMRASQNGDIEAAQALLDNGADVNAKNKVGGTALMLASGYGHIEIVQALLAKGADVNAQTNNGATALMIASQNGHKEVVQILLDKGADVNVKANNGSTALMWAYKSGHNDIEELLVKAGSQ
jgi:hypothetical protein